MIRVGLIGFGLAGRVFHAPLISSVAGLELAAVVERSTGLAAGRYPGIRVCRSVEELLAVSGLDLIVVASPSGTHFELARQVLEAGFHTVVDKPMCARSEQIAELARLAQARGRLLVPFHNRLWDSEFRTIQQLLLEGSLGRLLELDSTLDRWSPGPTRARWKDTLDGGGILLDLGTHLASQALRLYGAPQAVWADIRRERPGEGSDDAFNLHLRYSGLTVNLAANYLSAAPRPRLRLRGELGSFEKAGVDQQETALSRLTHIDAPNWGREPEEAWGTLTVAGEPPRKLEPIPGDYRLFYEGMRECLKGRAPQPATAAEAWAIARLLELARQSSAERREIACDLRPPFSAD